MIFHIPLPLPLYPPKLTSLAKRSYTIQKRGSLWYSAFHQLQNSQHNLISTLVLAWDI